MNRSIDRLQNQILQSINQCLRLIDEGMMDYLIYHVLKLLLGLQSR